VGRRHGDGDSPRAPPPAPRAAADATPAGTVPPHAARAGASLPRTVVLRDLPSRAAASGASSPRADASGALAPRAAASEALAPRSASASDASLPRTAVSGDFDAPYFARCCGGRSTPQPAAAMLLPVGTGIPAYIGVLPPPTAAAIASVTAHCPFSGPLPVLRRAGAEEGDSSPEWPASAPTRDSGPTEVQPVASGGSVTAGNGGFPLTGLSRRDGFAPLPGRGGERDVRSRLGPPVKRPPREILLTRVRIPRPRKSLLHFCGWITRVHRLLPCSCRLSPQQQTRHLPHLGRRRAIVRRPRVALCAHRLLCRTGPGPP